MVEKPTHYTIFITIHCHYAQSTHKNLHTHTHTIKATGEAIKVHSPVLCFRIGIWSWIYWALVVLCCSLQIHSISNMTKTMTTTTVVAVVADVDNDEFFVVSCITHYYCLKFFFHFSLPLIFLVMRSLSGRVAFSLYTSDHESNVHCHKNTFNLFRPMYGCTLLPTENRILLKNYDHIFSLFFR